MESSRVLMEALDYSNLYREEVMVVKISEAVLETSEKSSNVIRDISLLISAGIKVVIAHSDQRCGACFWQSIEPIALLDSTELSDIKKKIRRGITPVIFFGGSESVENERALVSLAKEVRAIKIVYVTKQDGLFRSKGSLINEMDIGGARKMLADPDDLVTLDMRGRVEAAVMACEAGISRVHIVGSREGSLLKEILTSEGSGTMIYDQKYKLTRKARKDDVADIFEVIRESIRKTKDSLSLEFVAKNVGDFWVFTVDDQIHGCVMVKNDLSVAESEIVYLGVSSAYESSSMLQLLVEFSLSVISKGVNRVYLDPEKNTNWLGMYPWFKELGFSRSTGHGKWVKTI